MFTCIACSNHLNDGSLPQQQRQDQDDIVATTPSRKQSVKSLTTHIKDMAIKASAAYKNCKHRSLGNSDISLGECRTGSSNSMPRVWGKELNGRIKGISSGEGTHVSLSRRTESLILMEEDEPKEWIAQVEPGVLITFVSMPQGANDLKRIRFSRELFNKWQAQRWWAENYEKVMELYNVERSSEQSIPLSGPPHSEDDSLKNTSPLKTETSFADASVRSSSSREPDGSSEFSVSNASDVETEWIKQDEPGVYITIRVQPDGTRELRRVRFSREKFGEMHARLWWDENKTRIQEQYL